MVFATVVLDFTVILLVLAAVKELLVEYCNSYPVPFVSSAQLTFSFFAALLFALETETPFNLTIVFTEEAELLQIPPSIFRYAKTLYLYNVPFSALVST